MGRIFKSKERLLQECLAALERGEALEEILSRHPRQADALRPSLQAAAWMKTRSHLVDPRPGWSDSAGQRLQTELRRLSTPRRQLLRGFLTHLRVFRLGFKAGLLILLGLAAFNVAYQLPRLAMLSLPGEFMYPLKLGLEQFRLAGSFDPGQDAQIRVLLTQQRALELQELLLEGRYPQLEAGVARFERQLQSTRWSLDKLAQKDPQLAQNLHSQLQKVLQDQAFLIYLLSEGTPGSVQGGLDQAFLEAPR